MRYSDSSLVLFTLLPFPSSKKNSACVLPKFCWGTTGRLWVITKRWSMGFFVCFSMVNCDRQVFFILSLVLVFEMCDTCFFVGYGIMRKVTFSMGLIIMIFQTREFLSSVL